MDIPYDPKALLPSCVNMIAYQLSISNLEFYGDDASFFTVTCIDFRL